MEGNKSYAETQWVANGIGFGIFMFIINGIIIPVINKQPFTLTNVLVVAVISLIGGLVYGYIIRLYMRWRRRRKGD